MFDLFGDNGYQTEGTMSSILGAARDEFDDLKEDISMIADKDEDTVEGLNNIKNKTDAAANAADSVSSVLSKSTVRSIVSATNNSILQFPVYMTDTNRANVAHLISKLFERVYADFVQTALANNPIIDKEEVNNLKFLKKFHTNINESVNPLINSFYEPVDEFDEMMQASIHNEFQLTENVSVEFNVVPTTDENIIAENARLMNEPLSGFLYLKEETKKSDSDDNLKTTSKTTTEDVRKKTYSKKELDEMADNISKSSGIKVTGSDIARYANPTFRKKETEEVKDPNCTDRKKRKLLLDETQGLGWANGVVYRAFKDVKTTTVANKEDAKVEKKVLSPTAELPRMLIKEADVKKSNGMLPYTVECTFIVNDKQAKDTYKVKYLIGIKTVLHVVSSNDLADDLPDLISGNSKGLRKVKYKTGEMKLKDYLFDITNLKKDAAKNINANKRWVNTLKQLSKASKASNGNMAAKLTNGLTGKNAPIPNATLIITSSDIISLKEETGIDLTEVANAKRLASSLFLIAFGIVDASAGTLKVIFPQKDNSWDVQSLSTIEAEIAKTDNSNMMKELNKIVNR